MAKVKTVEVAMIQEKECKTCIRFKAASPADAKHMATVYINNGALEELGNPESIKISIAVAE